MIQAVKDFNEYCRRKGYNRHRIGGRQRESHLVAQRVDVIRHLDGLGYSQSMIGHVMNRDHSAIGYWLNDEQREYKKERMRVYQAENREYFGGVNADT